MLFFYLSLIYSCLRLSSTLRLVEDRYVIIKFFLLLYRGYQCLRKNDRLFMNECIRFYVIFVTKHNYSPCVIISLLLIHLWEIVKILVFFFFITVFSWVVAVPGWWTAFPFVFSLDAIETWLVGAWENPCQIELMDLIVGCQWGFLVIFKRFHWGLRCTRFQVEMLVVVLIVCLCSQVLSGEQVLLVAIIHHGVYMLAPTGDWRASFIDSIKRMLVSRSYLLIFGLTR